MTRKLASSSVPDFFSLSLSLRRERKAETPGELQQLAVMMMITPRGKEGGSAARSFSVRRGKRRHSLCNSPLSPLLLYCICCFFLFVASRWWWYHYHILALSREGGRKGGSKKATFTMSRGLSLSLWSPECNGRAEKVERKGRDKGGNAEGEQRIHSGNILKGNTERELDGRCDH